VSINFVQEEWRVSAVFPGKDGKSDDFVFRGDCEGEETLVPPEPPEKNSGSDEDSESDSRDSS
jgi:hypothetical protein